MNKAIRSASFFVLVVLLGCSARSGDRTAKVDSNPLAKAPAEAVEPALVTGPYIGAPLVTDTDSASVSFRTTEPVLLDAAGFVSGVYYSDFVTQEAGSLGKLVVDGLECDSHLAFEQESRQIAFYASVSCIQVLQPGAHTIQIYDAYAGKYPNMAHYHTELGYMLQPVSTLYTVRSEQAYGPSVISDFNNSSPVVLTISGNVLATYYAPGSPQNAGIRATIEIDGIPCASDFSFEGSTTILTFFSSVSCIQTLAPGNHRIRVFDAAFGIYPLMSQYASRVTYEAHPVSAVAAGKFSSPTSSVSTIFSTNVPVILDVSGYLKANYYHPSQIRNAGVYGAVAIDGTNCGVSTSFEGSSASVPFDVSVRCIKRLEPGDHVLRAYDLTAGFYPNMYAPNSELQFKAVPLP